MSYRKGATKGRGPTKGGKGGVTEEQKQEIREGA